MKKLTEHEREFVINQMAQNIPENKLLVAPLIDYLLVQDEAKEIVEIVANSIVAFCNTNHDRIPETEVVAALALALFSTAASMYEGYSPDQMLH